MIVFVRIINFSVELEGESYICDQIAANPRMVSRFMDYELLVCLCEGGSDDDYMRWFKTINTGAKKLTEQEMRNALCDGSWVAAAKIYFSSTIKGQTVLCNDLLGDKRKRQQHLERVLRWWLNTDDGKEILTYMQRMREEPDAEKLWGYYMQVPAWVVSLFDVASRQDNKSYASNLRRYMGKLSVNWGHLYQKYNIPEYYLDPEYPRPRARELQDHPDIKNESGVYEYILGGERKDHLLDVRMFDADTRKQVWLEQGKQFNNYPNECRNPRDELPWDDTHADHKEAWSKGGRTLKENCQVLCSQCNLSKSNRQ